MWQRRNVFWGTFCKSYESLNFANYFQFVVLFCSFISFFLQHCAFHSTLSVSSVTAYTWLVILRANVCFIDSEEPWVRASDVAGREILWFLDVDRDLRRTERRWPTLALHGPVQRQRKLKITAKLLMVGTVFILLWWCHSYCFSGCTNIGEIWSLCCADLATKLLYLLYCMVTGTNCWWYMPSGAVLLKALLWHFVTTWSELSVFFICRVSQNVCSSGTWMQVFIVLLDFISLSFYVLQSCCYASPHEKSNMEWCFVSFNKAIKLKVHMYRRIWGLPSNFSILCWWFC